MQSIDIGDYSIDPETIIVGAYVTFLVVVAFRDVFTSSTPDRPVLPPETRVAPDHAVLDEDGLRHLEDGGTLRVPRWHGHELVLEGSITVDGGVVDEDTEDEADQEDVDVPAE